MEQVIAWTLGIGIYIFGYVYFTMLNVLMKRHKIDKLWQIHQLNPINWVITLGYIAYCADKKIHIVSRN